MVTSLTVGFREFLLKLAAGPQGSYALNNGLCTGSTGTTVSAPAFIRKHAGGSWDPGPRARLSGLGPHSATSAV